MSGLTRWDQSLPELDQTATGRAARLPGMDELTRKSCVRERRGHHARPDDPAVRALVELIQSESARALLEEPELTGRVDPGHVWLLWFAIGATQSVCELVERETDAERNAVFRHVVNAVFGTERVRSAVDPVCADRSLIEIFESAGAEAVQACMRGDKRLGYYLGALRVAASRES